MPDEGNTGHGEGKEIFWIMRTEWAIDDATGQPFLKKAAEYSPMDRVFSARDHGMHYGKAIFEGITFHTIEGRTGVLLLDEHVNRFYDGAKAIRVQIPMTKEELKYRILEAVQKSGLKEGYIRPLLTGGEGHGGTLGVHNHGETPTLSIYVCPPPVVKTEEQRIKGQHVMVSSVLKIPQTTVSLSRLKWNNYGPNVQAGFSAKESGLDDAIRMVLVTRKAVTDEDGQESLIMRKVISEMTVSNIFWIDEHDIIRTPSLKCNCLDGVTRNAVVRYARINGFEVQKGEYPEDDVMHAKEVFATGTATGITPITFIDSVKIGNGVEGEITHLLRQAYYMEVLPNNLTIVGSIPEPISREHVKTIVRVGASVAPTPGKG